MVKVERTFPTPASLAIEAKKKYGSCTGEDVVEQLRKDFHNKCYICEMKQLQDPQVEHLLPHENGKYPERKFDWENLFWSCGHCNEMKNQEKYKTGIVDCCRLDPEEFIDFIFEDNEITARAKETKDEAAARTAELICEVFHKKNTGMRVYASELRRKKLTAEMNILYGNLQKLAQDPESRTTLRKLKALLARESAFAAFKRNYVRNHLKEFPQLEKWTAAEHCMDR